MKAAVQCRAAQVTAKIFGEATAKTHQTNYYFTPRLFSDSTVACILGETCKK